MKRLSVFFVAAVLVFSTVFVGSSQLQAWRYSTVLGGGGYQESHTAAVLAPATVFAAVALGGILAVTLKTERLHRHHTTPHVHTHGHIHCQCHCINHCHGSR